MWLIDMRTQRTMSLADNTSARCTSVAISPKGTLLAAGYDGGAVSLWEISTGKQTVSLQARTQQKGGMHVTFSRDGLLLLASGHGENTNLKIWDVQTGELQGTTGGMGGGLNAIAASPTDPIVATGGTGNTLNLCDMETGEFLARLRGHEDQIKGLAFSHDGKLLASASMDNTVRIWEITVKK